MTNDDKSFYSGFACAIGTLIREHDEPTLAIAIMQSNGVTISQLQEAGVDVFDLELIKKAR